MRFINILILSIVIGVPIILISCSRREKPTRPVVPVPCPKASLPEAKPEPPAPTYTLKYNTNGYKITRRFERDPHTDFEANARSFNHIMKEMGFETQMSSVGFDFHVQYWTVQGRDRIRDFDSLDVARLWQLKLMDYGCKVELSYATAVIY